MDEIGQTVFTLRDALLVVLGFLGGAWCGHRFSLLRDRRAEFNAAVDPVRAWVLDQSRDPSPRRRRPALVEIDLLEQCMGALRRRQFRRGWQAAQQTERENTSGDGNFGPPYTDADAVRRAWAEVLPLVRRR